MVLSSFCQIVIKYKGSIIMNKFQMKLVEDGYCDERGAGFCATATKLPRGEYGIVCLRVKPALKVIKEEAEK